MTYKKILPVSCVMKTKMIWIEIDWDEIKWSDNEERNELSQ